MFLINKLDLFVLVVYCCLKYIVGALSVKMEINHFPFKTYLPKGLTQNDRGPRDHGFRCSLAQIKNRYPLSGLFARKLSNSLQMNKLY